MTIITCVPNHQRRTTTNTTVTMTSSSSSSSSTERPYLWTALKLILSIGFLTLTYYNNEVRSLLPTVSSTTTITSDAPRRLLQVDASSSSSESTTTTTTPSYMTLLMKDLQNRYDLFTNTPPEEIKYWFEYSGPLQVRMCVVCDVGVLCGSVVLTTTTTTTMGYDETHNNKQHSSSRVF